MEELATSTKLHAKMVRQELRFAFLSPHIVDAIMNGLCELSLRDLRKVAAFNWRVQQIELSGNVLSPNGLVFP